MDTPLRAPFDLRLVEPFVVLAEEQLHFPAAAARLNIGASGLSRQIARLQRELGTTLIGMDGRSHALTPAGRRFLVHARVIQDRLAGLQLDGALQARPLRIHIGLATLPSIEEMLAQYMALHPEARVEVAESFELDAAAAVETGIADIGIGLSGTCPPDAEFVPLETTTIGVLTSVDSPIAHRGTASWTELGALPLQLSGARSVAGFVALVRQICREFDTVLREPSGPSTTQPRFRLAAVRRGDAVLIRTQSDCSPAPPGTAWTALEPERRCEVGLIWRHDRAETAAHDFAAFAADWSGAR